MIDFFPKTRLTPLLGLAVGFALEANDINSGFSSQNLYDCEYSEEVILKVCNNVDKYDRNEDIQKFKDKFKLYFFTTTVY